MTTTKAKAKPTKAGAPSTTTETSDSLKWSPEWIDPATIVRLRALQVRTRLSDAAVSRYRERTAAGHEPPPIKVARVPAKGRTVLYLVDGWHRMEAGALQAESTPDGSRVLAHVADLSEAEARWEAARANMDHGVALKAGEYREVLKAFIRAGKHRKARGDVMSYRELAAVIGKPHTTIRSWVMKDFKKLARQMGGEGGNSSAGLPEREPLAAAFQREALGHLQTIRAGAASLGGEGRHAVVAELKALQAELKAMGTTRPDF